MANIGDKIDNNNTLRPLLQTSRHSKENKSETSNIDTKGPKKNRTTARKKNTTEHSKANTETLRQIFDVAETVIFGSKRHPPPINNQPLDISFKSLHISTAMKELDAPITKNNEDPHTPLTLIKHKTPPPTPLIDDVDNDHTVDHIHNPASHTETKDMSYTERCQLDSAQFLEQCPPYLRHVSQSYLRQADAFNLADQCNRGLEILPAPRILMSNVTVVPLLHRSPRKNRNTCTTYNDGTGINTGINTDTNNANATPRNIHTDTSDGIPAVPAAQPIVSFAPHHYNATALNEDDMNQREEKRQKQLEETEIVSSTISLMKEQYLAVLNQGNLLSSSEISSLPTDPAVASCQIIDTTQNNTVDDVGVKNVEEFPIEERKKEIIRVFCVEKLNERSGVYYRNFIAASYSWLWHVHVTCPPDSLHWYEVIREGRPCHLYFDLEFGRDHGWNDAVDGNALVDRLLFYINKVLRANWNLSLDNDYTTVYELDSSTNIKFSRHLIVQIPGHAFYNNSAMGHFVQQVLFEAGEELDVDKYNPKECSCSTIEGGGIKGMVGVALSQTTQYQPPHTTIPTTATTTINSNNNNNNTSKQQQQERVSFVDTAVYTKNRHFRCVYSSKGGKSAVLQPTKRYAMNVPEDKRPSPARIFQDTLVCNVVDADNTTLLVVKPMVPQSIDFQGSIQGGTAATRIAQSMLSNVYYAGDRQIVWKSDARDNNGMPVDCDKVKELKSKAEAAIPFIERIATKRGGQEARARTMAFCGYDTVAYSMIGPGSHYCENIGRNHKNNHVYYIVDFHSGKFAQKCHDPDCSRFRSAWMPLP